MTEHAAEWLSANRYVTNDLIMTSTLAAFGLNPKPRMHPKRGFGGAPKPTFCFRPRLGFRLEPEASAINCDVPLIAMALLDGKDGKSDYQPTD